MIFCKHPPRTISLCLDGIAEEDSYIHALGSPSMSFLGELRAFPRPRESVVPTASSSTQLTLLSNLWHVYLLKAGRNLYWSWNQTPISHIPLGIRITSPQLWLYSLLCEPGRSTKLCSPKSGKTSGKKLLGSRHQRHHNLTSERCRA